MHVSIIGTGFVGVVTAAVLAKFGHQVIGLDIDPEKIKKLEKGIVPFYEPQLSELLKSGVAKGNLTFTTEYARAIPSAEIIMLAVGTPSAPDGTADLKYLKAAATSLAPHLKHESIVVIKSTVPPGTNSMIADIITQHSDTSFYMASLPEFLREGVAVDDTLNCDRVVIGAHEQTVIDKLLRLHQNLPGERLIMTPESAQMCKYTANAYLAQRITFINQIADLCEKNGADIDEVIQGIGADNRIGSHYWYPGLGYGGSCFPKDVKELAAYAQKVGENDSLLITIDNLNRKRMTNKLREYEQLVGGWKGKRVALLGLSFKPQTNDLREAPSTKIIPQLLHEGAEVFGYDPQANEEASKLFPDVTYKHDPYEACENADVVIVLIGWPEITNLDLEKLATMAKKQAWLFDTRNVFSPEKAIQHSFNYRGIGKGQHAA